MALRVLLADESTTIKKVMQLALQDFAVEVKSVQSGIDVLEVAKQFKPDIIFADVLLQKRNGYEVCAELKKSPDVGSIPVVLMWSSFMDLDERQAQASRADRRLEKPFDVENLRQIVLELVPKTRSQRLAHFLQFPESVTEPLQAEESEKRKSHPPPAPKPAPPASNDDRTIVIAQAEAPAAGWSMESFDDIGEFAPAELKTGEIKEDKPATAPQAEEETFDLQMGEDDFQEIRIAPNPVTIDPPTATVSLEDNEEPWSHQNLSRFKLDLDPEQADVPGLALEVEDVPESLEHGEFLRHEPAVSPALEFKDIQESAYELPEAPEEMPPALSSEQLERVIRAQSKDIIESVVRKMVREIVPDLASNLIREELNRLLEETKSP